MTLGCTELHVSAHPMWTFWLGALWSLLSFQGESLSQFWIEQQVFKTKKGEMYVTQEKNIRKNMERGKWLMIIEWFWWYSRSSAVGGCKPVGWRWRSNGYKKEERSKRARKWGKKRQKASSHGAHSRDSCCHPLLQLKCLSLHPRYKSILVHKYIHACIYKYIERDTPTHKEQQ